jgi:hypothetical protein
VALCAQEEALRAQEDALVALVRGDAFALTLECD